jgi:hypothetical protein
MSFALGLSLRVPGLRLGGGGSYRWTQKVDSLFGAAVIASFPMNELTGTAMVDAKNGNNGLYTSISLAQLAVGGGDLCPYFDGANGFANIYSAGLDALINKAEGSMILTVQIPATTWANGTKQYIAILRTDGSNQVAIIKYSTANRLELIATAAGSGIDNLITCSTATLMTIGVTWSKAANKSYGYVSGLSVANGAFGTWSGDLSTTNCCVGSFAAPKNSLFTGYAARLILLNRAATAPEMALVEGF